MMPNSGIPTGGFYRRSGRTEKRLIHLPKLSLSKKQQIPIELGQRVIASFNASKKRRRTRPRQSNSAGRQSQLRKISRMKHCRLGHHEGLSPYTSLLDRRGVLGSRVLPFRMQTAVVNRVD